MLKREPLSNSAYVCSKHASKPGAYTGQDPKGFVGKHVKLGFPAKDQGRSTTEHMWVRVTKLYEGTENEQLEGTIDNDPVLDCAYKDGDTIAFSVKEIEDVYASA